MNMNYDILVYYCDSTCMYDQIRIIIYLYLIILPDVYIASAGLNVILLLYSSISHNLIYIHTYMYVTFKQELS